MAAGSSPGSLLGLSVVLLVVGCPCDQDRDGHRSEDCGGDDCDDGDPSTYLGAPEVCGDGVDNDCLAGVVACGPWGELTIDQAVAEIGFESNGLTEPSVAALGDWDGDGVGDVAVGNRYAGPGFLGFGSGRVWLHSGPLEGTVRPEDALVLLHASDDENAGSAVEVLSIAGAPVLAIGLEGFRGDGPSMAGMVALLRHGDLQGVVEIPGTLPGVRGIDSMDRVGRFLDSWQSDGGDDVLLVSAPSGFDDVEGALVLLDSLPDGVVARDALPLLFENDLLGLPGWQSAAVVPGNADHPDWIFVGLPRLQFGSGNATTGTVVGFPFGGDTVTTTTAPLRLEGPQVGGPQWGDYFGWHLASADFDGDGTGDLAVFAPRHKEEEMNGAVHILFGRWDDEGWAIDDRTMLIPDGPLWSRGYSDDPDMDVVGDLNGDGHPELVIGSNWTGWDSSWYGCAYLFYGPIARDASFEDVDATICGVHADEGVGVEVEAGGDLDGDGYDDLLVASYRAVYVFPGGPGP